MKKELFLQEFQVAGRTYGYYDIQRLEAEGLAEVKRLPFSIRVLVENLLRNLDGSVVREEDLLHIARWRTSYEMPVEIPYYPARVLIQDFTGVPAVVDLAVMRDAVEALGADAARVNPLVPVELVVDHSVQVDYFGTAAAAERNVALEYERNSERYALLKWARNSLRNFKVVPPGSGICHQVNLEHLGRVVIAEEREGRAIAYPDTQVGLDSHTTMIDAIGVLGWGVGGIEAEAVMLGQPYYLSIPEVVGVRLTGVPGPGNTATDLVLALTERLREVGVVEKFVEYFGPGVKRLTIPDRATISNMTPEYGATLGFFPVDERTIAYLRLTGRDGRAELVDAYARRNGLFFTGEETPDYTRVVELDLGTVEPAVSGPARPQDRVVLSRLKDRFAEILGCEYRQVEPARVARLEEESGRPGGRAGECRPVSDFRCTVELQGTPVELRNGSVVIAAITSCTNTSNPHVMLGAGLLAKKAVEHGLRVPPYVKTSLAPGSKVVLRYLEDAGLLPYLEGLGFHLAGYGCTTCIGNSGPLPPAIEKAIASHHLNVAAVLSGNRNFEARIHQRIQSNFIGSPMLVVAFALAGCVDIDLTREPVGIDPNGEPVYLEDIWPSDEEIQALVNKHVRKEFFELEYGRIYEGDRFWRELPEVRSLTYAWDEGSTYLKKPPYFEGFTMEVPPVSDIRDARVLVVLGDTVTTDHISPAGAIAPDYPAGSYLIEHGVAPGSFNSYGSRRGNHEVMMRGTFGNIRLKNRMMQGREGSFTRKFPAGEEAFIYEAAMQYRAEGTPLVVLAGRDYGTGSSRDWAAKGTKLLGVRAVIAQSFERIHRSNLVGMGILPLVFEEGQGVDPLGLDGSETFTLAGLRDIRPRQRLTVKAVRADGREVSFQAIARIDTEIEVSYFLHGGILPYVLRKIMLECVPLAPGMPGCAHEG